MKIKTCIPNELPLSALKWESFADLLGRAHAVLSRYDAVISSIKNPKAVFSLFTTLEILSSLQSQKVHLTLKELLEVQAGSVDPFKKHSKEIKKVMNYRLALAEAAKNINARGISFSLLCKIHGIIKQDAKEKRKEVGTFRKWQNWIGKEGCKIEEAYFYPPDVKSLHQYMVNLKKYFSYKEKDPLVQIAIFFAQMLIIHPFMDGNGRVARALIPFLFCKKKLLSVPLFYLSSYFKRHRLDYFHKLFTITSEGDWENWIRFFLEGIIEEGEFYLEKASHILSLYDKFLIVLKDERVDTRFVDLFFEYPIFDKKLFSKRTSELRTIKKLKRKKMIVPYKNSSLLVVKGLIAER